MGTFLQQDEAVKKRLRILDRTQSVPTHPIVVHPDVPADVKEQFVKAFLKLSESPEGTALLQKIPMNQPVTTSVEDYEVINNLGLKKADAMSERD